MGEETKIGLRPSLEAEEPAPHWPPALTNPSGVDEDGGAAVPTDRSASEVQGSKGLRDEYTDLPPLAPDAIVPPPPSEQSALSELRRLQHLTAQQMQAHPEIKIPHYCHETVRAFLLKYVSSDNYPDVQVLIFRRKAGGFITAPGSTRPTNSLGEFQTAFEIRGRVYDFWYRGRPGTSFATYAREMFSDEDLRVFKMPAAEFIGFANASMAVDHTLLHPEEFGDLPDAARASRASYGEQPDFEDIERYAETRERVEATVEVRTRGSEPLIVYNGGTGFRPDIFGELLERALRTQRSTLSMGRRLQLQVWLSSEAVVDHEGLNREVKRVFARLGFTGRVDLTVWHGTKAKKRIIDGIVPEEIAAVQARVATAMQDHPECYVGNSFFENIADFLIHHISQKDYLDVRILLFVPKRGTRMLLDAPDSRTQFQTAIELHGRVYDYAYSGRPGDPIDLYSRDFFDNADIDIIALTPDEFLEYYRFNLPVSLIMEEHEDRRQSLQSLVDDRVNRYGTLKPLEEMETRLELISRWGTIRWANQNSEETEVRYRGGRRFSVDGFAMVLELFLKRRMDYGLSQTPRLRITLELSVGTHVDREALREHVLRIVSQRRYCGRIFIDLKIAGVVPVTSGENTLLIEPREPDPDDTPTRPDRNRETESNVSAMTRSLVPLLRLTGLLEKIAERTDRDLPGLVTEAETNLTYIKFSDIESSIVAASQIIGRDLHYELNRLGEECVRDGLLLLRLLGLSWKDIGAYLVRGAERFYEDRSYINRSEAPEQRFSFGYPFSENSPDKDKGPRITLSQSFSEAMEIKPGEVVLDPLAGSCEEVLAMARKYPHSDFIGLELNPENLIRANVAATMDGPLTNLTFMPHDVTSGIPLGDNSVDHIVLNRYALWGFMKPAQEAFFREVARVIRPGGRVWIDYVDYSSPGDMFMLQYVNERMPPGVTVQALQLGGEEEIRRKSHVFLVTKLGHAARTPIQRHLEDTRFESADDARAVIALIHVTDPGAVDLRAVHEKFQAEIERLKGEGRHLDAARLSGDLAWIYHGAFVRRALAMARLGRLTYYVESLYPSGDFSSSLTQYRFYRAEVERLSARAPHPQIEGHHEESISLLADAWRAFLEGRPKYAQDKMHELMRGGLVFQWDYLWNWAQFLAEVLEIQTVLESAAREGRAIEALQLKFILVRRLQTFDLEKFAYSALFDREEVPSVARLDELYFKLVHQIVDGMLQTGNYLELEAEWDEFFDDHLSYLAADRFSRNPAIEAERVLALYWSVSLRLCYDLVKSDYKVSTFSLWHLQFLQGVLSRLKTLNEQGLVPDSVIAEAERFVGFLTDHLSAKGLMREGRLPEMGVAGPVVTDEPDELAQEVDLLYVTGSSLDFGKALTERMKRDGIYAPGKSSESIYRLLTREVSREQLYDVRVLMIVHGENDWKGIKSPHDWGRRRKKFALSSTHEETKEVPYHFVIEVEGRIYDFAHDGERGLSIGQYVREMFGAEATRLQVATLSAEEFIRAKEQHDNLAYGILFEERHHCKALRRYAAGRAQKYAVQLAQADPPGASLRTKSAGEGVDDEAGPATTKGQPSAVLLAGADWMNGGGPFDLDLSWVPRSLLALGALGLVVAGLYAIPIILSHRRMIKRVAATSDEFPRLGDAIKRSVRLLRGREELTSDEIVKMREGESVTAAELEMGMALADEFASLIDRFHELFHLMNPGEDSREATRWIAQLGILGDAFRQSLVVFPAGLFGNSPTDKLLRCLQQLVEEAHGELERIDRRPKVVERDRGPRQAYREFVEKYAGEGRGLISLFERQMVLEVVVKAVFDLPPKRDVLATLRRPIALVDESEGELRRLRVKSEELTNVLITLFNQRRQGYWAPDSLSVILRGIRRGRYESRHDQASRLQRLTTALKAHSEIIAQALKGQQGWRAKDSRKRITTLMRKGEVSRLRLVVGSKKFDYEVAGLRVFSEGRNAVHIYLEQWSRREYSDARSARRPDDGGPRFVVFDPKGRIVDDRLDELKEKVQYIVAEYLGVAPETVPVRVHRYRDQVERLPASDDSRGDKTDAWPPVGRRGTVVEFARPGSRPSRDAPSDEAREEREGGGGTNDDGSPNGHGPASASVRSLDMMIARSAELPVDGGMVTGRNFVVHGNLAISVILAPDPESHELLTRSHGLRGNEDGDAPRQTVTAERPTLRSHAEHGNAESSDRNDGGTSRPRSGRWRHWVAIRMAARRSAVKLVVRR